MKEEPDQMNGFSGRGSIEGAEEEDEFVEEQEEVPSAQRLPGEEGGAEDEWEQDGVEQAATIHRRSEDAWIGRDEAPQQQLQAEPEEPWPSAL